MRRVLIFLPGLFAVAACAAIAGLEDHQPYPAEGGVAAETGPDETGPSEDSSSRDGNLPDRSVADSTPLADVVIADAGSEEQAPPTTFSSLGDPTKWEFFDLAPLPKTMGYAGGAFDGHYVYFASNATSLLRYDTSAPFASETSWLLATSPNIPASNDGLVRLGSYIYVSPTNNDSVGRYDTTQPFSADAGGFGLHEPPAVAGFLFQGGCTDGKRVYFAPLNYFVPPSSVTYEGTVLVYDPNGPGFFTDSSWTVVNIAAFNPQATGMANCVFDGQYVYFGDYINGVVARYDPTQLVSSSNAWVFFQTTQIAPTLKGYIGMVFTGRHVVFVPWYNGASYSSTPLAYDTQGKFGELTSWTPFDLAPFDAGASAVNGYLGGQFDGRYVYLSPHMSGVVFRWDTTLPFNAASSWEAFNLTTLNPGASGFFGTAFDGQYVYFSANVGTIMARFKARDRVGTLTPVPSFF
jgi:hypothetical protein